MLITETCGYHVEDVHSVSVKTHKGKSISVSPPSKRKMLADSEHFSAMHGSQHARTATSLASLVPSMMTFSKKTSQEATSRVSMTVLRS